MEVRSCKCDDINVVYELICELEECQFDYEKFKLVYRSKLNNEKNHYFVAIYDKMIVGFISIYIDYQLHHEDKVATIEELIINNKYRSMGIGKILVEHAVALAKKQQCEIIELTSNLKRLRAHQFYQNNGFIKSSYKLMRILKDDEENAI